MKKQTGFCLQCDDGAVALAEVRPMQGSYRVEAFRRTSATTGPDRTLLNRLKRQRSPLTILARDGDINHGIITTPALRGKALRRAMAGSLARDEGGAPADWRLSFRTLAAAGAAGDGTSHFVLYGKQERIDALVRDAEAWGVQPTAVLPEFLVLDQFYRAHGPGHAELPAWNLVFIGRQHHFLNIGTSEVPLLVRDLPADLSGGRDPDEYVARLATEIDRSLHFARQVEPAPQIERLIICGDPAICERLTARLSADLAVAAVHWAIEDHFTWGPHQHEPDDLPLLMAAALNFGKPAYDLMPQRSPLRLGAEGRRHLKVASITAATVALPVLIGGGMVTARIQDGYLHDARGRINEAMVIAESAERVYQAQKVLLAREDQIAQLAGEKPDLEAVLLKLADLAPGQVVFSSLSVSERSHSHFLLQVEGTSEAATAEEAQAAFLLFLSRLDSAEFLLRRSEPKLVRLLPGDGALRGRKTTVFHMDLILKRDGQAPVEEQT